MLLLKSFAFGLFILIPANARYTLTLEDPLDWVQSHIILPGEHLLNSERSALNQAYASFIYKQASSLSAHQVSKTKTAPHMSMSKAMSNDMGEMQDVEEAEPMSSTAHSQSPSSRKPNISAVHSTKAASSTADAMANMPGMEQMSGLASELLAFVQNASLQLSSLRSLGQQNIQSIIQDINSQVSVVTDFARTNSIASNVLLPLTNFPEFRTDVQLAAASLQSVINSEVSYVNQQLASIASVASSDISAAAQDIGQVLSSLYGFTQQAVELLLSSPLLTALPILNPALLLISAIAAADPVKLFTDYPAWQSEVQSRQSVANANMNSAYTFISTGLPKAESAILGLLSQLAKIGNSAMGNRQRDQIMSAHNLLIMSQQTGIPASKADSGLYTPLPGHNFEMEYVPQTSDMPSPTAHLF